MPHFRCRSRCRAQRWSGILLLQEPLFLQNILDYGTCIFAHDIYPRRCVQITIPNFFDPILHSFRTDPPSQYLEGEHTGCLEGLLQGEVFVPSRDCPCLSVPSVEGFVSGGDNSKLKADQSIPYFECRAGGQPLSGGVGTEILDRPRGTVNDHKCPRAISESVADHTFGNRDNLAESQESGSDDHTKPRYISHVGVPLNQFF